ncbi:MAG TPA: DUF3592 domain-containing protein [Propionicimonas sp.]
MIYSYDRKSGVAYYSAVCRCGWFAEPIDSLTYPDREVEGRMAAAALAHDPAADTSVAFPLDRPGSPQGAHASRLVAPPLTRGPDRPRTWQRMWATALYLLCAVAVLVLSVGKLGQAYALRDHGREADATVVRTSVEGIRDPWIDIEFTTADGERTIAHHVDEFYAKPFPTCGQTMRVLYDPHDPHTVVEAGVGPDFSDLWAGAAMTAFFSIAAWGSWTRRRSSPGGCGGAKGGMSAR